MMSTRSRLLPLGLAVVTALLSGCGRNTPPPAPESADKAAAAPDAHEEEDTSVVHVEAGMLRDLRITTRAVESRSGGDQVRLLGELGVNEGAYAEVGAPIAARVIALLVQPGASVRAGQPLARLSSPTLGQAHADYQSAKAREVLASTALARKRELAAERIAPVREVQEAESTLAEARAAVRSAQASIEGIGAPVTTGGDDAATSTFVLRAPVTGVVIERSAMVGQMLDPATPAFRVGDLSTLWLTVHAFERDAVRVKAGTAARVSFAALPGETFTGAVTMVGRQVDHESRTVPVRIDIRNTGGRLRPGMTATAALPVGDEGTPVLAVPVAAVQRVRNQWCVFLPRAEGTFEIRAIGRGRDLGGEVEVLSGLKGGDTVVVDGAFLLRAQAERGGGGHDDH